MYIHPVSGIWQDMRFKVYLMRRRGRRLLWREVVNGPAYIGDLRTHAVDRGNERFQVARLAVADAPAAGSAVPDLYEPVLLGFSPLAFRLRGFESVGAADGSAGVVQEWHCELP
jgi:hypothetical protein